MRWNQDHIDLLCAEWAQQRRKILGIILPLKLQSREILGQMRCTLGQVREEGEGASQGTFTQNFPEVYLGDALFVHRAWCSMDGALRVTLDGQYVWKEIPVKIKAAEFGFTVTEYWRNLKVAKSEVSGYFKGCADQAKFEKGVSTQSSLKNAFKVLPIAC